MNVSSLWKCLCFRQAKKPKVITTPEDWECLFCLSDAKKELVRIHPCGHIFHDECLLRWEFFSMSQDCCACRRPIRSIIAQGNRFSIVRYCFHHHARIEKKGFLYLHAANGHKKTMVIRYRNIYRLYKELTDMMIPPSTIEELFLRSTLEEPLKVQGGVIVLSKNKHKDIHMQVVKEISI